PRRTRENRLRAPAPEPYRRKTSTSRRAAAAGGTRAPMAASRKALRRHHRRYRIGSSTYLVHLRNIPQNPAARWQHDWSSVCLINRFDRAVDRIAGGGCRHEGNQADLRQHRQVPQPPDRRAAEQRRELVAPGRAEEAAAGEFDERKQRYGAAPA